MKVNRTVEDLNKLLAEAIQEVKSSGMKIGDILPIIKLTRATKEFGRCTEIEDGQFQISISKYFKDNAVKEVKQTLIHEVLHTIPNCLNHGTSWKAAAKVMNDTYGYNISRTNNMAMDNLVGQEDILKKYVIKCAKCGNEIYRQRKCKLVNQTYLYKCKCGGDLELQ